ANDYLEILYVNTDGKKTAKMISKLEYEGDDITEEDIAPEMGEVEEPGLEVPSIVPTEQIKEAETPKTE
ncbi:MAG: hypothetical protein HQL27_07230, partial [Candidatus Omnitrophica bacterium]|nr:hypothetical protein [Candidatus Omnitrophota bacterium]